MTFRDKCQTAFACGAGLLLGLVAFAQDEKPSAPASAIGTKAPEFSLPDSTGKARSLKEFRGKKQVALVFYPALFRSGG